MELLQQAIIATVEAGKKIMSIYDSGDFGVEMKSDNSPLTLADKAAHVEIVERLESTGIPVLSEEGKLDSYADRKDWEELWIVDPLDGTKEFVKKTGEFTVNIALVRKKYPVMGVVFVPALRMVYCGDGKNAYKIELAENWRQEEYSDKVVINMELITCTNADESLNIVASVSHLSEETKLFAQQLSQIYKDTQFLSKGSSLKICMVAEGKADIYPRLGPTMEWDTAAGQAVAESAGAYFVNWETQERFDYNRPDLLNDWFVVGGSKVPVEVLQGMIKDFKNNTK